MSISGSAERRQLDPVSLARPAAEEGVRVTGQVLPQDEGPLLNESRKTAGPIQRLTFYCEGDGVWQSVGGYGEAV
jgi:hypothetical protein